ncbi:MAG: trypsin-like peptidase domain-containing protein [Thermoguttaceae bacterium]
MAGLHAILLAASAAVQDQTVLLSFSSDTCAPCRQMAPVVERLAAQGHPIRTINVSRQPDLAARFGVRSVPCFVMLADGREVDRQVGTTTLARLEQMLALGRAGPPRAAGPQPQLRAGSAPGSIPLPAITTDRTLPASAVSGQEWGEPPDRPNPEYADLLAATVRLRIKDASGQSCGSGTIIDARSGEALVLTCGHLFRESQGKAAIQVDLFGPTPAQGLEGRLIHYHLDRDLALLSIRTPGPVTAARVAPPGFQVAKGAKVIHLGCNNGGPPTARVGHVTSLDRFLGPPNLQVSGLPVQGRSGGGVFSSEGYLIGVCNAAIPTDNEGLYAGLGAIHAELDELRLGFVFRQDASDRPDQSRLAAVPPNMPKRMSPPSELVRLTDVPQQPAGGPRAPLGLEDAEVILIIRPRNAPAAQSQVIVLDHAPPALLQQVLSSGPPAEDLAAGYPEADEPGPDWSPRWLQPGYRGQ